jgi:DNA polymerase-3 subunit beta
MFERAVLVATENRLMPVKIDIQDDDLLITAKTERGQVEDGIPCETDGKDISIHFNPRYFIEALRAIEDERVIIKFNTPLSPCTIHGLADENSNIIDYKYLIVPLRIPV